MKNRAIELIFLSKMLSRIINVLVEFVDKISKSQVVPINYKRLNTCRNPLLDRRLGGFLHSRRKSLVSDQVEPSKKSILSITLENTDSSWICWISSFSAWPSCKAHFAINPRGTTMRTSKIRSQITCNWLPQLVIKENLSRNLKKSIESHFQRLINHQLLIINS